MQLTKGAIGNLINRYKAVLKKCHLLNVFGSLAVAGMLVMGGAATAGAADYTAANRDEFNTVFAKAQQDESASIKVTSPITDGSGIGIFNKNNPTIKNLTIDFNGNTYTFTAPAVGSDGYESQAVHLESGRAVILQNGTLDVAKDSNVFQMGLQNYCDLTLENMVVDGSNLKGSAPYTMSNNHGNVVINKSTIIAKEGGVAFDAYYWPSNGYADGVSVTVTDSIINGRIEVTVDGKKAIGDNTHSVSISGGTLVGGLTATDGGQLYTVGTTSLSNVAINNNTATNRGGGIYNAVQKTSDDGVAGRGLLTLDGVSLSGNSAAQGGAIYNAQGTVSVESGTIFDKNASTGQNYGGGAIYSNGGSVTIGDNVQFTNNYLNQPISESTNGDHRSAGGAIAAWGSTDLNIGKNVTFENNGYNSETGKAAWASGGAIYLDTDTTKLAKMTIGEGTIFRGNVAGSLGGAIYAADSQTTISSALFDGNKAGSWGGAMFIGQYSNLDGDLVSLNSSTFTNNEAGNYGGALAIHNGANVVVNGSAFVGNKVLNENGLGGAIYNEGKLTFTGTNTFSGNTAAEGGDIYNEGDLTFDGSNTSMEDMVLADGNLDVINNSLVYIGTLDARGGSIFVDPSGLIIGNLTDNKLGSNLVAGSGAITNVGNMDNDVLVNAITDAGMSVNPGMTTDKSNAVLALNNSITLGDAAQIVVDADAQKGPNDTITVGGETVTQDAYFGDDSLLVVNAANLTDGTAIKAETAGQEAFVATNAKLRIINAKAGEWVTVLDGFTIVDEEGNPGQWSPDKDVENLDYMLESQAVEQNGDIVVLTDVKDPTEALPGIDPDLAPMMLSVWENALNDVDSPDMGVRFLSRAVRADYINGDAAKSAATIESAARIAFAGAVPQMTKMASDAATNAVVNRLGFANPADGAQAMNAEGQIVDRNTTGFALWIAPLWQSQHGWGMEAGNLDYGFNGNLGGVSLGADYTFENAIRAGITFNIGGGYAETSGGDLNSTENRMTFWGLGAYAGWNYENFGLMADVSYTSTWNQLEQDLDPGMGMGDLEADVQATAISAGLRAEYKLETSVLDIIPHVGVRYMSLNTWGYDVDANGGTVMEGDGFHQDIWTFPVGVTFSKDITLDSGWFFKPSVDFSVIPAAGDIKAREDVRFTGAPAVAEMETQMMDYLTWQGGVGVQLGNDNLSFGVNYTLQAGQNTTGHGVFGNFRYEF